MLAICNRYCRNREEAEDVVQEGFVKVFRSIRTFQRPAAVLVNIQMFLIIMDHDVTI